ncbi:MAG: CpsD/CapB family tyrosine-protein kinase [Gammaproteobacteria bacterium]|nr:CpsD/CapB family tyrosine-protein kinase [Gammaproteobacteria bacterium]
MTDLKKISDENNMQIESSNNTSIDQLIGGLIDEGIDETKDIELVTTKKLQVNRALLKKNNIYIDSENVNRDDDVIITAYKELRTSIIRKLDHLGARTLMVTSPAKGNGKTTVSLNLAINIAKLGRRTALLVDLDLRQPSIHHVLGYTPEYGVADVSKGLTTIDDALITPGVDRLSILCGKKRYTNSSEILASNEMQSLLNEIRSRYKERIIIFDAPPLLGCDDSSVLSSIADACLVVVEENQTTYAELDMAMEKLGNVYLAGYVLNKSKEKNFDQYYY